MISDDRMLRLLRDADALNTFEHGRIPARAVRRIPLLAAAIAAAVLIAGAVVAIYGSLNRSSPRGVVEVAGKPPRQDSPDVAASPTSSLLLAVYQNGAGKLSCVNWSTDVLKGRAVTSLSANELTRLGLTLACDPEAARILVVGLEGPAGSLPCSDARAQAVAQCLSTTPPCAAGVFNPRTCAAAGCLDTDVKVRIESLALK